MQTACYILLIIIAEPNLVSQTAHSVAKKGVKKKDLNDVELREITSELLPLVRMDHVIPPTHEVLTNAIKRGLVSKPPSHMIGDDLVPNFKVNAWVRGKNNGLFVKPRLFLPYWEEARVRISAVNFLCIENLNITIKKCLK